MKCWIRPALIRDVEERHRLRRGRIVELSKHRTERLLIGFVEGQFLCGRGSLGPNINLKLKIAPGSVVDVGGAVEVAERHKALNSLRILARYCLQRRQVAEIFLSIVVFINRESLTRQSHYRFGQGRRILRRRFREGKLLCNSAGNQNKNQKHRK